MVDTSPIWEPHLHFRHIKPLGKIRDRDLADRLSRCNEAFVDTMVSFRRLEQACDDRIGEIVGHAFTHGLLIGQIAAAMEIWSKNGDYVQRGRVAKQHDDQTLKAANARISAERAEFWRPYQQEFQRLVSEGMKPDTARSEILSKWAEREDAPSMKTARKWLKLDGKAD